MRGESPFTSIHRSNDPRGSSFPYRVAAEQRWDGCADQDLGDIETRGHWREIPKANTHHGKIMSPILCFSIPHTPPAGMCVSKRTNPIECTRDTRALAGTHPAAQQTRPDSAPSLSFLSRFPTTHRTHEIFQLAIHASSISGRGTLPGDSACEKWDVFGNQHHLEVAVARLWPHIDAIHAQAGLSEQILG
jgi:hypothetical protein